jgi:hypothetical protein
LANSGSKRPENDVKAKIGFIELMLALAVTKLHEGPAWSYELNSTAVERSREDAARPCPVVSRAMHLKKECGSQICWPPHSLLV